ncbi:hypothetical protein GOP47_0009838 [Adiantum capillus-veneris]|uniref:Uncharacterized protein n=1 Tax=Adiantum capillus-veneris TaxID=13818 RepID=A0A9D4UYI3_ADICA|nr:hypothetical protein GOP47_0009838 [Adiantum capillus-veneris]
MLIGYSNDKEGDDISSISGLLDKQVYEKPSLAWKPRYDDKSERQMDATFLRHAKFYDMKVQGYLDEGY